MQEKLIIYLHNNQKINWAIVSDGRIRQQADQDEADGLTQIAEGKDVIVIVPAEDVLLTVAKLPKMNYSRTEQALPYALEEQLIDQVDTLHFATTHHSFNGDLPVAVVAVHKMQQWLAWLQTVGIKPTVLMPCSLSLPFETGKMSLFSSDAISVRLDTYQGLGCDKNNLQQLFQTAVASKSTPDPIREYEFSDVALEATKNIPINLLQGKYAVKKTKYLHANKILRLIVYLAISWVVLLFLYPAVSSVILQHRLTSIDKQINAIYRRQFPHANGLIAPKERMEEKLKRLQAQTERSHFLLLIAYVGTAMKETPITLKRMDFQNKRLTLDLIANSSENFSAFINSLIRQGLSVKQQNASLIDSRIHAIVLVE